MAGFGILLCQWLNENGLTQHHNAASFPHELLLEVIELLVGHDRLLVVIEGLYIYQ